MVDQWGTARVGIAIIAGLKVQRIAHVVANVVQRTTVHARGGNHLVRLIPSSLGDAEGEEDGLKLTLIAGPRQALHDGFVCGALVS